MIIYIKYAPLASPYECGKYMMKHIFNLGKEETRPLFVLRILTSILHEF